MFIVRYTLRSILIHIVFSIGTTSVPVMKLRPGGKYNPRKLDNARVMEIAKSMANSYSMYSDTGIAVVEGDYATTTQEEKDALLHALRDTESGVVGYLAGGQHARAVSIYTIIYTNLLPQQRPKRFCSLTLRARNPRSIYFQVTRRLPRRKKTARKIDTSLVW